MRVAIDGGGYAHATVAFEDANHRAATHHDALAGILRRYAAMAGDDAGAADFAATYDEAATESLGALRDLVDSFAAVGRLADASIRNHRRADASSVLRGRGAVATTMYEGSLPARGFVTVRPASVPSSLGGDPSSFPAELNWIVDQVEGFVWPDADLDRLRAAASTWRSASRHVGELTSYTDTAQGGFALEVSPEIELATAATADLAGAVDDLSAQYAELAAACDTYADHVEEQRRAILDLIWSLLRDAVVIQGIGIVLGAVTGGITAAGAAALNAAKIAAEAPKFARILATLRTLTTAVADTVRVAVAGVARVRARLRAFVRARLMLRTEAGAVDYSAWKAGWLKGHEVRGSHTLERHVGKSDDWLKARLEREGIFRSSSFADDAAAERALADLFRSRAKQIDDWLASESSSTSVTSRLDYVVGHTTTSAGVADVHGVRAILIRDPSMPDGFRILTSYPMP